jgi:hypothetical protein
MIFMYAVQLLYDGKDNLYFFYRQVFYYCLVLFVIRLTCLIALSFNQIVPATSHPFRSKFTIAVVGNVKFITVVSILHCLCPPSNSESQKFHHV